MVRVFTLPGTAITAAVPSRKLAAFSCSLFNELIADCHLTFSLQDGYGHADTKGCCHRLVQEGVRFVSKQLLSHYLLVLPQITLQEPGDFINGMVLKERGDVQNLPSLIARGGEGNSTNTTKKQNFIRLSPSP